MQNSTTTIKYFRSKTSSAFVLDMRGSTKIVRILSKVDKTKLKKYTDFLMELKLIMFEELTINKNIEISFNDTGDGFMCLLWHPRHALSALRIASGIDKFLIDNLGDLEKEIETSSDFPKLSHGIGLHSGSSVIYRIQKNSQSRDFAYGLVINTAARIESFTKVFINNSFLASGYFVKILRNQFKKYCRGDFDTWANRHLEKVVKRKIDINDAKEEGHILYSIKKPVLKLPYLKSST